MPVLRTVVFMGSGRSMAPPWDAKNERLGSRVLAWVQAVLAERKEPAGQSTEPVTHKVRGRSGRREQPRSPVDAHTSYIPLAARACGIRSLRARAPSASAALCRPRRGAQVTVFDPLEVFGEGGALASSGAEVKAPHFFYKPGGAPPAMDAMRDVIKAADAYVVVTAEYNHR